MTNYKYQLKLTVGQDTYFADINWNNTLDCIFNKRHRRISDYASKPYPSNADSLSGYMTGGVIMTGDTVPKIPVGNTLWRGFCKTNYSDYTGTVGKVGIVSENIIRNPNKTFETMSISDMIEDANLESPVSVSIDGVNNIFFNLAKDGEELVYFTGSYYDSDYKISQLKVPGPKWGLEGCGGVGYRDRLLESTDLTASNVAYINDEVRHNYVYNKDTAHFDFFEVDEQTQTQTIGGQDITYYTWNACFCFRNDFYGTTYGDSYTQNDDYIIANETLLFKVLRVGQYNSQNFPYADYPFKPSGCDVYFNMTTRQYEFNNATEDFNALINYQVIDRETFDDVSIGRAFLTNTFNVSTTNTYSIIDPNAREYVVCFDENDYAYSDLISQKIPVRFYAATTDGNTVYTVGGTTGTDTAVYSYDLNDLLNGELNITFTFETNTNINNFLHTYYRKNLYTNACIPSHTGSGIEHTINKETGIVNDKGYLKWTCAGNADFGNISIASGQTFKFELVEIITQN